MAGRKILILGFMLLIALSICWGEVKTFTVKETDLVQLIPQANDLNQDQITYYFSYPLNDKGEWQTDYGDAGEYFVNITASDGQAQTVQRVLLIVQEKNRAPIMSESKISIKETQLINLKLFVSDPDGDALSYTFTSPFDTNGIWKTKYGDAGSFLAEITISDGIATIKKRVEIEVLPTNQEPKITSAFSEEKKIIISENQTLNFSISAADHEESKLTYSWILDEEKMANEPAGEYYFDFSTAGEHSLEVKVSDGDKEAGKKWIIQVEDVKRAPKFNLLPITSTEGETINLNLPAKDVDGNEVTYTFDGAPFSESGTWKTDYNDAGKYTVKVVASNEAHEYSQEVKITVLDKDRAPKLELEETVYVNEGEELKLSIKSYDEDGDKLEISFGNLPAGAVFNQKNKNNILSWTPSYDTITKRRGWFGNVLNAFRIEHKFLVPITFPISITSCGKELCTSKNVNIIVSNTNRAPQFTKLSNIKIKEEELAQAKVETYDSDGDIVRVYFASPLGKRNGKWKTEYGDKGNYTVEVMATDGETSTTVPITVEVQKNNRMPSLNIRDDAYTVNEGQQFMFTVSASDADKDNLTLRLDNLPQGASFKDGVFLWAPSYDTVKNKTLGWWSSFIGRYAYLNKIFSKDKETIWLSFVASDGEIEKVHPVKVTVKNVNRAPELLDYLPAEEVTVWLNKPVIFHVTVGDLDKEQLYYTWRFDGEKEITGTDTVKRTFTSSGIKKVHVTVSDGRKEVEKEWVVKVVGAPIAEEAPTPVIIEEQPQKEPFTVKIYVIEKNISVPVG